MGTRQSRTFRVSARDAAHLAQELEPKFESVDLIGLPNYHIYLRLMIDGQVSVPFSAETIDRLPVAQAAA